MPAPESAKRMCRQGTCRKSPGQATKHQQATCSGIAGRCKPLPKLKGMVVPQVLAPSSPEDLLSIMLGAMRSVGDIY